VKRLLAVQYSAPRIVIVSVADCPTKWLSEQQLSTRFQNNRLHMLTALPKTTLNVKAVKSESASWRHFEVKICASLSQSAKKIQTFNSSSAQASSAGLLSAPEHQIQVWCSRLDAARVTAWRKECNWSHHFVSIPRDAWRKQMFRSYCIRDT